MFFQTCRLSGKNYELGFRQKAFHWRRLVGELEE
jgi:hypothetical protein